jgi:hypothetical protein
MAVGDSVTIKFLKALSLCVTKENQPFFILFTRRRLRPINSCKFQITAVSEIRNVLNMTGFVTMLLTVSLYAYVDYSNIVQCSHIAKLFHMLTSFFGDFVTLSPFQAADY